MHLLLVAFLFCVSWYRTFASNAWSSGHCVSLPSTPEYRLINPCAGVVDYPFYLPPGTSMQSLQQQASAALSNTVLPQLSTTCVSKVVAYQCARIYRKCYPGVSLADSSSYNYFPYGSLGMNEGIPLQRPCGSVCSALVPSCGVLYASLFGAPNCSAVYDYNNNGAGPYPTEFDLTNNASQCYTPATVTFAGMSETYLASATAPCSGYVKDFVIPFASRLNTNFTLLQRPGVVQNLLNTQLSAALSVIPKDTVTPSCFQALLRFQCYSLFIRPLRQTLYQALINGGFTAMQAGMVNTMMPQLQLTTTAFTIPEFPPISVCTSYASTCASIIPLIGLRNAALVPNCTAVVPGSTTGAKQFPTANQTINSVVVATGASPPSPAQLSFRFMSGPNPNPYFNQSQLSTLSVSYSKQCPGGLGSLCSSSGAPTWSSGRCMTLPSLPTARLVNPCVGVVNYAFYLPPGTTPQQLQQKANESLSQSLLLQFPSDCLKNLVAYTCAKIYMKCATGVDVSNSSTYDLSTYEEVDRSYGLPFQRPCESVCTAVQTSCPGIINKLYGMPSCEATVDFSIGQLSPPYPRLFDTSNNASRCFSPRLVAVAGATERFTVRKQYPCSGFVKEFFVPPASRLNPNFTLLQAPGTVQTLINTNMVTAFNALPRFIPPPCFQAFLRYQCYTVFLSSISQTLSTALMNGGLSSGQVNMIVNNPALASFGLNSMAFTIPQFPPREVCTNYSTACAKLIPLLAASNPSLRPNCSATVSIAAAAKPQESHLQLMSHVVQSLDTAIRPAAQQFPENEQVVTTVSVETGLPAPLPSTLTFKFKSGPNPNPYHNVSEASTLASSYTASCPRGFVIPEHPDNDGNRMIGDTACAMACISPIWTPDEWDEYEKAQKAFPVVGAVFGIVFLLFLLVTQSFKDVYLLFIFGLLSLVASLDSIHVSQQPMEDVFCYDNSIQAMQRDDQPDSNVDPCVVQGAIIMYTYFACAVCTVMLTVDWRLKYYPTLYETMHTTYRFAYYGIQLLCTLILSLIPMLYAYDHQLLGFSRTQPWCFIRNSPFAPKDADLAVLAIPLLILVGIYFLIFCWIDFFGLFATKTTSSSNRVSLNQPGDNNPNNSNPNDESLDIHRIAHNKAVHFAIGCTIFITFVIFVPFLGSKGVLYGRRQEYLDSLSDWTSCVFQNYNANDPERCFEICGEHATTRPPNGLVPAQLYCLTGNMLFIAPVFVICYTGAYCYQRRQKYAKIDVMADQRVVTNTKVVNIASPSSPPAELVVAKEVEMI